MPYNASNPFILRINIVIIIAQTDMKWANLWKWAKTDMKWANWYSIFGAYNEVLSQTILSPQYDKISLFITLKQPIQQPTNKYLSYNSNLVDGKPPWPYGYFTLIPMIDDYLNSTILKYFF